MALQSGTSCLLRELSSGEVRYNQVLGVRNKEIVVTVKGDFSITSNAIECLTVTIDGLPYSPPDLIGRHTLDFKDIQTTPPPQPPPPSKSAPAKTAPAKTTRAR